LKMGNCCSCFAIEKTVSLILLGNVAGNRKLAVLAYC